MELFSITTSALSLIISLITLIFIYKGIREQIRVSKLSSHYPQLLEGHKILLKYPNLIELHNISKNELDELEISQEEFVYILISFEAVQSYYEFEGKGKIDYNDFTPYRKTFLKTKKVRVVWEKIMKERMTIEQRFIDAIEEFYKNNPI